MTMRVLAIAAGLGGLALFAWIAPKAFDDRALEFRLDGHVARQKTNEFTRAFWNTDISSWRMKSEPNMRNRYSLRMWQERYGKTELDYLLTADSVKLTFTDPEKQRDFVVTLSGNGRVAEIDDKLKGRAARKNDTATAVDGEERARQVFGVLTGEFASQFQAQAKNTDSDSKPKEFRWKSKTSHPSLEWQALVRVEKDGVRSAKLTPQLDDQERRKLLAPVGILGDTALVTTGVIFATGGTIVSILFLFAWVRKMVDRKSFWTAAALMFVCGAPVHFFSSNREPWAVIGYAGMCLVAGAAFAMGQISARETEWTAWREMRLLLGRQFRARGIYSSLSWGALWGGTLALIPLAIHASHLFPDTHFGVLRWALQILHRYPMVAPLEGIYDSRMLTLFGVLLPWLTQGIGVRWISIVIFFVPAVTLFFFNTPFVSGVEGAVAYAIVTALVSLVIYLRFGLLALLAAALCEESLSLAAMFVNSSSPYVQQQGWWLLLTTGVVTGAVMVAARFTVEMEPADTMAARFLSQRERLKAEFSMAQQAQQRLLPSEAPALPGFAIATACLPARDVGGDLFDYFRLADGRFGFCVADVSGKGMPAALYMTLTKGLLAAASPEANGLADLARRVNKHLHIACKRKMFVTAAMAAVDVETRTVEYLRAGHNPALLLEKASGKAKYLVPPGVGLGLAGPALFDRGVRTEEFTLASGDILVFYSDGVTEAMNQGLELYGEARFQARLESTGSRPAADVLEAIRKDLAAFMGSEPPHDDITLLVLQTI